MNREEMIEKAKDFLNKKYDLTDEQILADWDYEEMADFALSLQPPQVKKIKCPDCNGDGYTSEHDPSDPHEGGMCSSCPIQVQCERCMATGEIDYQPPQVTVRRYKINSVKSWIESFVFVCHHPHNANYCIVLDEYQEAQRMLMKDWDDMSITSYEKAKEALVKHFQEMIVSYTPTGEKGETK